VQQNKVDRIIYNMVIRKQKGTPISAREKLSCYFDIKMSSLLYTLLPLFTFEYTLCWSMDIARFIYQY